jgi:hypothetical protein
MVKDEEEDENGGEEGANMVFTPFEEIQRPRKIMR